MRRTFLQAAALSIALAIAGPAPPASAQTEVELRAATSRYRFVEISRSFNSGVVFDGLYTGEPGLDEAYVGLGYDLSSSDRTSFVPILYAVFGSEYGERGATLGFLADVDHATWHLVLFAGHYWPARGEIGGYTFVDSLDLTRKFGRWEAGASAAAFEDEGDILRVAGPVLKLNDRLGTWAAAARFGDESEFRLVRTLAF
jgi:hypothetical protein